MDQITIERVELRRKLSKREQLVILEIGGDQIDSASGFVNYMSEAYGFSKSSVWYILNRLKEKHIVDFASKDEPGKRLELTDGGSMELRSLSRMGVKIDTFVPNNPRGNDFGTGYIIGKIALKTV